jgi:uncharacterized protein (DUF2267 family)
MNMIDELIQAVEKAAHLSHPQAEDAVRGMLRYLAAKLPSPQFGEFQARLHGPASPSADEPPGPTR